MLHYVYILRSSRTGRFYRGYTTDLDRRLIGHHQRKTVHTDKTDGPFELTWHCAFHEKARALAFEKYLKTGSGRAFATKHLV